MKWEVMPDDDRRTTFALTKGLRRKIGQVCNRNDRFAEGLERIIDAELRKQGYDDIPSAI